MLHSQQQQPLPTAAGVSASTTTAGGAGGPAPRSRLSTMVKEPPAMPATSHRDAGNMQRSSAALEEWLRSAPREELVAKIRDLLKEAASRTIENASLEFRVKQLEAEYEHRRAPQNNELDESNDQISAPTLPESFLRARRLASMKRKKLRDEAAAAAASQDSSSAAAAYTQGSSSGGSNCDVSVNGVALYLPKNGSEEDGVRMHTKHNPGPAVLPRTDMRHRVNSASVAENRRLRNNAEALSLDLQETFNAALLRQYNTPEKLQAIRTIQLHFRRYRLNKRMQTIRQCARRRSANRLGQTGSSDNLLSLDQRTKRLSLTKELPGPVGPQKDVLCLSPVIETTDYDQTRPSSRSVSMASKRPSMSDSISTSYTESHSNEYVPEDSELCHKMEMTDERMRKIGIYHFNRDPRKGIEWMIRNGLLANEPKEIASFFHNQSTGLCRQMIGEYLGHISSDMHASVLSEYVEQFDLSCMGFDQALRYFLASFRLPGEAQKIEKILEEFARKYHTSNPGLFQNADTPFILAFSVVMLNTDAHNQANKHKMTKEQFIRNNRGIDNDNDLPQQYLEEIYDRIQTEEFQNLPDNTTVLERLSEDITNKEGCLENLVVPYRQFIRSCDIFEIDVDKAQGKSKHARVAFLFNDRIIITKPAKNNKFQFRKNLPLHGMFLDKEVVAGRQLPVYTLVSTLDHNLILHFSIDPKGRNARHFEEDMREMIFLCQAIEQERVHLTIDEDHSPSSKSLGSRNSFGGSLGDLRKKHRASAIPESTSSSSLSRKNTLFKNTKGMVGKMWASKKRASDKSLNAGAGGSTNA
eukprot:m.119688 g.119688  ORF g.119688 m.119688 type:complete len:810 (+) comp16159_c0_seq2:100-2529(+)